VIAAVVCVIVGLEFFYEYLNGEAHDLALCMTPQEKQEALGSLLLQHVHSHR
jgi:hypothetical protein